MNDHEGYKRSWDSIIEELVEEGHDPMARLAKELKRVLPLKSVYPGTSMLSIFIRDIPEWGKATKNHLTLIYADGRGGGRPSNTDLDEFEIAYEQKEGDVVVEKSKGFRQVGARVLELMKNKNWDTEREKQGENSEAPD